LERDGISTTRVTQKERDIGATVSDGNILLEKQLKSSQEECSKLRLQLNNMTRSKRTPLRSLKTGQSENLVC